MGNYRENLRGIVDGAADSMAQHGDDPLPEQTDYPEMHTPDCGHRDIGCPICAVSNAKARILNLVQSMDTDDNFGTMVSKSQLLEEIAGL